eukprot:10876125-Alexandrium_andersonii.AAC.1
MRVSRPCPWACRPRTPPKKRIRRAPEALFGGSRGAVAGEQRGVRGGSPRAVAGNAQEVVATLSASVEGRCVDAPSPMGRRPSRRVPRRGPRSTSAKLVWPRCWRHGHCQAACAMTDPRLL